MTNPWRLLKLIGMNSFKCPLISHRQAFRLFIVIISLILPSITLPNILNAVRVEGIQGPIKANVEARLHSFFNNSGLIQESDETVRRQITLALAPFGYLNPRITLIPHGTTLKIMIDPGPETMIESINIRLIGEGERNVKLIQAINQLPLKNGLALNSETYENAKQNLLTLAEQEGYLKAHFQQAILSIKRKNNKASIDWILDTGFQYYFGQLRFKPSYISEDLLYRYAQFKYGEPYSVDNILSFNSHLSGSGYFKEVTVTPHIDNNRFVPIDVTLHPAHPTNYTFGLGYGTDTGLRGRVGLQVYPLNRQGDKFSVLAQGSFRENALQAQYTIPGFDPVTDQYTLSSNISTLNYNSGYANSVLFSLAKQHNQAQFQRSLSLNALYERFNYTLTPKQEISTLFPKLTLTRKNVSDELFSPNGYNVTVNALGAKHAVLSQVSFTQFSIDGRAAIMSEKLGLRLYLHGLEGVTNINHIDKLPLSLALLLGGADNLKAYSFASIGPGKRTAFGSIELQKETLKNWFLTGFYDVGNVYQPFTTPVKRDVGLGLMWVSPVGPIKISVAEALDDHGHLMTSMGPRLVINMGPDL